MKITIERKWRKPNYIIGKMLIDGKFFCNTLEPPERKQYGCIPEGTYKVEMYPAKHFGLRPLVKDVPGRSGILIHEGNTVVDTKGCILVGLNKQVGMLHDSRKTLRELISRIKKAPQANLTIL